MNVASKELCQELYELSGWKTPEYGYDGDRAINIDVYVLKKRGLFDGFPAYDLGYLLRKLPPNLSDKDELRRSLCLYRANDQRWIAKYGGTRMYKDAVIGGSEISPENATTKLAIELFKQKILIKETP